MAITERFTRKVVDRKVDICQATEAAYTNLIARMRYYLKSECPETLKKAAFSDKEIYRSGKITQRSRCHCQTFKNVSLVGP